MDTGCLSPELLRVGEEVLGELRNELHGQARVVRMQLLASRLYEAAKAELAATPPNDLVTIARLKSAIDQCSRAAETGLPQFILSGVRGASSILATAPAPRDEPHTLRVIQGGRAA